MRKAKRDWAWLIGVGVLLASASVEGAVRLPHIFGDNMVLQRDKPVPVWGWAGTGETVKVKFGGQEKSATPDDTGRWMVRLDAMQANKTGQEMTVTGENTITFKNVLVGEVWVCSGQSNMEFGVGGSLNGPAEAKAADIPVIRHIKIPYVHYAFPQSDCNAAWQVASPATIGGCTAVGFFFARELVKELDVPVGLIDSNWGGTLIEPWTCPEGFAAVPELKDISQRVEAASLGSGAVQKQFAEYLARVKEWVPRAEKAIAAKQPPPSLPGEPTGLAGDQQQATRLYNGKIAPLVPYAIRGALWYQGESNGGEGESYVHKTRALVGGWRQVWKQGDFSFYWVQLANFQKSDPNKPEMGDGWARVREAQLKALSIPNTGMAVIIDIGAANDIHPKNKQDVGKRLAAWALAKDFGKKIEYSGPLYQKCQVEGNKMRITFDHADSGLLIGEKSGLDPVKEAPDGKVKWISIAGEDKKFFWADAVIDGKTLLVSSDKVPNPVAVRYAFAMNPQGANLYNKDGLPASPLRTDNW
ncbi:MAG: sialate O-acetylesterase [Planctomycetota bacterium]|nr:sialate O-acetylesterase [Planctomycetota bacterium]